MIWKFLLHRRGDQASVKMRGASRIEYREGERKVTLEGERLASNSGPSLWFWFAKDHEWCPPGQGKVSAAEKIKIKAAIESEMAKHGVIVDIDVS